MATVQMSFKFFMMMKWMIRKRNVKFDTELNYITQYTLYIENVTSKNVHDIARNCVLCATGLLLHSVVR